MTTTTKRLFVVTITREVLVVADDDAEAHELVTYDDLDDDPDYQAAPMTTLPGDWELGAIPYGYRAPDAPDRTVGEWIERGAAPEYTAMLGRLTRASAVRDLPFDELLARSSLGTPEAVAIRDRADPKIVARILARADELQVVRDTLREAEKEARAAKSVDEAVDLLMAELVVEVARRLAAEKAGERRGQ